MSKTSFSLGKLFFRLVPGKRRPNKSLFLALGLGLIVALIFGALLYLMNKQGRI
jgi:hypothetical protein